MFVLAVGSCEISRAAMDGVTALRRLQGSGATSHPNLVPGAVSGCGGAHGLSPLPSPTPGASGALWDASETCIMEGAVEPTSPLSDPQQSQARKCFVSSCAAFPCHTGFAGRTGGARQCGGTASRNRCKAVTGNLD